MISLCVLVVGGLGKITVKSKTPKLGICSIVSNMHKYFHSKAQVCHNGPHLGDLINGCMNFYQTWYVKKKFASVNK